MVARQALFRFYSSLKAKAPAITGVFASFGIALIYSFKELGSERFFGDFRLR